MQHHDIFMAFMCCHSMPLLRTRFENTRLAKAVISRPKHISIASASLGDCIKQLKLMPSLLSVRRGQI